VKLTDFDFELPEGSIARFPADRRDESRLMVVERQTGRISHRRFGDLIGLVKEDDFLVINNSRVVPVRLLGTIGERLVEILITGSNDADNRVFEALALPAKKFKPGVRVTFGGDLAAEVIEIGSRGKRRLRFNRDRSTILKHGYAPLPPYIKRKGDEARQYRDFDLDRYQTVYARHPGSIAAPTAGLHFSPELLDGLRRKTDVLEITLNVGEATFQKIEVEEIEDHRMGRETITIGKEVTAGIEALKQAKNLVAVGTTTVRSLETYARLKPEAGEFESELFISPGFKFWMVDKLITNFHLPRSSLFILVCAFGGIDLMKEAYRIAVEEGYRFFSYGDAMFII
jgi:S-adenosylmethionine:tRNA ribosyltransferase-isomerase